MVTTYVVPTQIQHASINQGNVFYLPGHANYVPGTDVTDAIQWWLTHDVVTGAEDIDVTTRISNKSGSPGNYNIIQFQPNQTYWIEYGLEIGLRAAGSAITDSTGTITLWPKQNEFAIQYVTIDLNGSTLKQEDNTFWSTPSANILVDTTQGSTSVANVTPVNSTGPYGGIVATNNTLQDTGKRVWSVNTWVQFIVRITGGTGAGQTRTIVSNTTNTLTVTPNWTTIPDSTSRFRIEGPVEPAYKPGFSTPSSTAPFISFRASTTAGSETLTHVYPSPSDSWVGRHVRSQFGNKTASIAYIEAIDATTNTITLTTGATAYLTESNVRFNLPSYVGRGSTSALNAVTIKGDHRADSTVITNITGSVDAVWKDAEITSTVFASTTTISTVDTTGNTLDCSSPAVSDGTQVLFSLPTVFSDFLADCTTGSTTLTNIRQIPSSYWINRKFRVVSGTLFNPTNAVVTDIDPTNKTVTINQYPGNLIAFDSVGMEGSTGGTFSGVSGLVFPAKSAANEMAYQGTYSLKLTTFSTVPASTIAYTPQIAVTAGTDYTASAYVRCASDSSTTTMQLGIGWYNSSNVFISESLGTQITDSTSNWTQFTCVATAPAGAAYAKYNVHIGPTTSLHKRYMDQMVFSQTSLISRSNIAFTVPATNIFTSGSKVATVTGTSLTLSPGKAASTLTQAPVSLNYPAVEPRRQFGVQMVTFGSPGSTTGNPTPFSCLTKNVTLQNGFITMGNSAVEDAVPKGVEPWYGLSFRACKDIVIDNVDVTNCWSDFINLGPSTDRYSSVVYQADSVTIQNCSFDGAGRHAICAQGSIDTLIQNCSFKNIVHWVIDDESFATAKQINFTLKDSSIQNDGLGFMSWGPAGPIAEAPISVVATYTTASKIVTLQTADSVPQDYIGGLVTGTGIPAWTYVKRWLSSTQIELSDLPVSSQTNASIIIKDAGVMCGWTFDNNYLRAGHFGMNVGKGQEYGKVLFTGNTTAGSAQITNVQILARPDETSYTATDMINIRFGGASGVFAYTSPPTTLTGWNSGTSTFTASKAAKTTTTGALFYSYVHRFGWRNFTFTNNINGGNGKFGGAISGVTTSTKIPMIGLPWSYDNVTITDNACNASLNGAGQPSAYMLGYKDTDGTGFVMGTSPYITQWTYSGNYWNNAVDNQFTPSNTVSINLTASPNPGNISTHPTFTAALTPSDNGSITGDMCFRYATTITDTTPSLMNFMPLAANTSVYTRGSAFKLGRYYITAYWPGNLQYRSTTSSALTYDVGTPPPPISTTTTLLIAPTIIYDTEQTVLTATVSPSDATGRFDFFNADGDILIGTCTVVNGSGSITLYTPAVGSYLFYAKYQGDGGHSTSQSSDTALTVLETPPPPPPARSLWTLGAIDI